MNRCLLRPVPHFKALLLAAAAFVLLHLAAPVLAQTPQRLPPIPQAAQSGVLVVTTPPDVLLNGISARLSPGSRIHGYDNMLVMSGALIGQKLTVRYLLEPLGLVHEVWILTDAEVAALARARP